MPERDVRAVSISKKPYSERMIPNGRGKSKKKIVGVLSNHCQRSGCIGDLRGRRQGEDETPDAGRQTRGRVQLQSCQHWFCIQELKFGGGKEKGNFREGSSERGRLWRSGRCCEHYGAASLPEVRRARLVFRFSLFIVRHWIAAQGIRQFLKTDNRGDLSGGLT